MSTQMRRGELVVLGAMMLAAALTPLGAAREGSVCEPEVRLMYTTEEAGVRVDLASDDCPPKTRGDKLRLRFKLKRCDALGCDVERKKAECTLGRHCTRRLTLQHGLAEFAEYTGRVSYRSDGGELIAGSSAVRAQCISAGITSTCV
jgi:hypothetical protein